MRWDTVQTVKRGETIEYLLQSQCLGKDQDFVQVRFFEKLIAFWFSFMTVVESWEFEGGLN